MSSAPQIFDRRLLRLRRDRAVLHEAPYPDFLLERIAQDFRERIAIVRREFAQCVSLGAYNGLLARHLRTLPNVSDMIDVDASDICLERCLGLKVVADEEAQPFSAASLDLVVSGLSLHFANDLPGVLIQARQSLRPDGLFLAALLGGETLRELREAWLVAEADVLGGASPRVAPFADVRELGSLLQRAGFALPVADSDTVEVTYATPLDLIQDLKAMGASNPLVERRRAPVTRRLLFRASEVYQQRFGLKNGRIPATFEIVTLTGWAPHESQQKPLAPGSAEISLKEVLRPKPNNPGAKE